MQEKIENFLDKCKNICLKKIKKSSVSPAEVINVLYGILIKSEDRNLVRFNLTKFEKCILRKEYNEFSSKRKNLFWEELNSCL